MKIAVPVNHDASIKAVCRNQKPASYAATTLGRSPMIPGRALIPPARALNSPARVLMFLALVLALCLRVLPGAGFGLGSGQHLDPEVIEFLKGAPKSGAEIRVIIQVKAGQKNDPSQFRGHSGMVSRFLRNRAAGTMGNVMSLLTGSPRKYPAPVEIWAANAIIAVLDRELLQKTLELDEVEAVELLRTRELPPLSKAVAPPAVDGVEWSLAETGCNRVWRELGITGRGVTIGIIDSGIWAEHPDLRGRVRDFRDFCTDPSGTAGTAYDDLGHGTHCAGTICGGSALGPSMGAAPGADLLVAKAFGKFATAGDDSLLGAMQWMLDPDDDPDTDDAPALVSNSWGLSIQGSSAYGKMVEAWKAAGILPVFAAGNTGPDGGTITMPGGRPDAISVAAYDCHGAIADFSARGPVEWEGAYLTKPDISAPGVGINSADFKGGRKALNGTSMACPQVSGIIALMLEANPSLGHREILSALSSTARDRGVPGKDNEFGHGLIDARAAVAECISVPSGESVDQQDGIAREILDFISTMERARSWGTDGTIPSDSITAAISGYRERLLYLAIHRDSKLVRDLIARLEGLEELLRNPASWQRPESPDLRGSRDESDPTRFSRDQNGIISDSLTGLQWLEGPDLPTSWEQAQAWTASLSEGWRTPTLEELGRLYLPDSDRRGIYGDPLCIDKAFARESAYCLWSVERYPGTAWIYDFSRGYAHWIDVYFPGRFDRAVAVRKHADKPE